MGKQHQAMEEDAIATGKTHAHAKNVVRECFAHERGYPAPQPGQTGVDQWRDRDYLDWCEAKANRWCEMLNDWGYHGWSNVIQTLTGSITYHEWLKKDVGL